MIFLIKNMNILKIFLFFVVFYPFGVCGQKTGNEIIITYQRTDSLHKYLRDFVKKYDQYNSELFPILLVDCDTAKIDGQNFLNVKFSTYTEFCNLIVSNTSDVFLSGGEVFDRKVIIRINIGRSIFIDPLNSYLHIIKYENRRYYRLLMQMCNKRIKDLSSGICLGIETIRYSPEMNLVFDEKNNFVDVIYSDESNDPLLKNIRKLGIKYEL